MLKRERHLALKAKNLFDVAAGAEQWEPNIHAHLSKVIDAPQCSQAYWEFENDEDHTYDRLVVTLAQRGLTIAIEHRDFDRIETDYRKSIILNAGRSKVHVSDLVNRGRLDQGSTQRHAISTFKRDFAQVTTNLGLFGHMDESSVDQNESSSAILASAA